MASFADLIRDTAALEAELENPRDFHFNKKEPYHTIAFGIAQRVLLGSRPQGVEEERWQHKVAMVLERITSHLVLGGNGIMLAISDPPESHGELDKKDNRPGNQIVTHADVVEWIRAGEAGLKGGKRITARDRAILAKSGENGLATIVMRAYYSLKPLANYVRLRRVIQRYLHGSPETADVWYLDIVAAAWAEHFSQRYPEDLKSHVANLCRNF